MEPYLWIAYDYVSIADCLQTLDTILKEHPDSQIIHEIGRPTLIQAAREGIPILSEFRTRLNNGQILVADFKGYDLPYLAEGKYYYSAGVDLTTVMAMAPDEAIQEAIQGAQTDHKMVAFDLMSYLDDDIKVERAKELVKMGATLISCHTGCSEQTVGKTPDALLERVYQTLKHTNAKIIVMGGLKPEKIKNFSKYLLNEKLFAIVVGSAITRSPEPNRVVAHFLEELSKLHGKPALGTII